MRICQYCENQVDIREQSCPCCGSELREDAAMIAQLGRRRSNKALFSVGLAVASILCCLAYVVQADRAQSRRTRDTAQSNIYEMVTGQIEPGQQDRELLSLQYRSLARPLPQPFVVVNAIEANAQTQPVYDVLVRDNVYGYDGLHDLAVSLAKNRDSKRVAVRFWTRTSLAENRNADHVFRIERRNGTLNVEYELN